MFALFLPLLMFNLYSTFSTKSYPNVTYFYAQMSYYISLKQKKYAYELRSKFSFPVILVKFFSKSESPLQLLLVCVCDNLLQSCLTLCDPENYSPPGSSVHGILQARILE